MDSSGLGGHGGPLNGRVSGWCHWNEGEGQHFHEHQRSDAHFSGMSPLQFTAPALPCLRSRSYLGHRHCSSHSTARKLRTAPFTSSSSFLAVHLSPVIFGLGSVHQPADLSRHSHSPCFVFLVSVCPSTSAAHIASHIIRTYAAKAPRSPFVSNRISNSRYF